MLFSSYWLVIYFIHNKCQSQSLFYLQGLTSLKPVPRRTSAWGRPSSAWWMPFATRCLIRWTQTPPCWAPPRTPVSQTPHLCCSRTARARQGLPSRSPFIVALLPLCFPVTTLSTPSWAAAFPCLQWRWKHDPGVLYRWPHSHTLSTRLTRSQCGRRFILQKLTPLYKGDSLQGLGKASLFSAFRMRFPPLTKIWHAHAHFSGPG